MLKKPDFKVLDGLRGIAATYVVINHCRGNLFIGGNQYSRIIPLQEWSIIEKVYFSLLQLTSLGREFVILFFVLSGFSIAHSLQKKDKISSFYKRRFIRLYLPYVIALIWAALVFQEIWFLAPQINQGKASVFQNQLFIISNLFYLPHGAYIGQFWSLTFEVIFYLLIPFAITRVSIYYVLSITGYMIGWIISWKSTSGTNYITQFLFDYNIFFMIGIWLYKNYEKVEVYFQLSKVKTILCSVFIFLSMSVVKFLTYEENKISMLMAAILSIILIVNFLSNKVKHPAINFLGKMSYTIYITHLATIFLYKAVLMKTSVISGELILHKWLWVSGIVVCILISYLIYLISEKPTQNWLSKLRKRSSSQVQRLNISVEQI